MAKMDKVTFLSDIDAPNITINNEQVATDTSVDTKIANLVDSAPEALNTLGELATALNEHEDAYDALLETVGKKVDKTTTVNGHALSSNVTVTKSDIGLGNVDNTADANKNVKYATSAGSADTATNVASQGVASANVNRHVWFSDNNTETKRNHNDNFTYNPATNTLNVGAITGAASEAYLAWGGRNISNGFSPLDAALIDELGANRLAGISNDKVVFERSSDAGATWSTYDSNGRALCTTSGWATNEKAGASLSANDWHRITIEVDGSIYCDLRKIAILFSTQGASGCQCKVEWGDYSSPTAWTTATTAEMGGWSGWNIIDVNNRIGSSAYGNAKYVRLTFSQTAVLSDYDFCSIVYKLRFYSSNCWSAPSSLGDSGHLYTYDDGLNAGFPAKVAATSLTINKTATTKTDPTQQEIVINYSLPEGETLTEANTCGIGFHISNTGWANLVYDGVFKFMKADFSGYEKVQASKFIGDFEGNAGGLAINVGGGGFTTDQYGNFIPDEFSQEWHLYNTSNNAMFTVGWKTGDVTAAGTIRAANFINHEYKPYATQEYVTNAITNAITTALNTPV